MHMQAQGGVKVQLQPTQNLTLEGGGGGSAPPSGCYVLLKDAVPIVQEAGWAPRPVWTDTENLASTIILSSAHTKLLYWLRYPGHQY
jgi:hypothetical protein